MSKYGRKTRLRKDEFRTLYGIKRKKINEKPKVIHIGDTVTVKPTGDGTVLKIKDNDILVEFGYPGGSEVEWFSVDDVIEIKGDDFNSLKKRGNKNIIGKTK